MQEKATSDPACVKYPTALGGRGLEAERAAVHAFNPHT